MPLELQQKPTYGTIGKFTAPLKTTTPQQTQGTGFSPLRFISPIKEYIRKDIESSYIFGSGKMDMEEISDLALSFGPMGSVKVGGKIINAIDDATKRELIKGIDYLRVGLKKGFDERKDSMVRALAEKFNINQEIPSAKIANFFEDLIEKTKTFGGERDVLGRKLRVKSIK